MFRYSRNDMDWASTLKRFAHQMTQKRSDPPQALKVCERLTLIHMVLHGNRHAQAGRRVFFDTLGLRVAELNDNRIPYGLVDRAAMRLGGEGHFSQIAVEQCR